MPKPGRPKGSTTIVEPRRQVCIRFPESMYRRTKKAAKDEGRGVPSWIRRAVMIALERGI